MTVKLILKPRAKDTWHDAPVLLNALDSLAEHKSMIQAAMWINMAANIQAGVETILSDEKELKPIEIELSNTEAKALWKNLIKLSPEKFGRNPQTGGPMAPHIGVLGIMLYDFADQLGQDMPAVGDDDDDA